MNNPTIKTINSIRTIEDLGLNKTLQSILRDYDPREIVRLARLHQLTKLRGVGKIRASQIFEALNDNGYIFTESIQSDGVRRLLAAAHFIPNFQSAEEYEARQEFTPEQIDATRKIVGQLNPKEKVVVDAFYGLSGNEPLSLEESGKLISYTREGARFFLNHGMRRLRHPVRKQRLLEIFPEFAALQPKPLPICMDSPCAMTVIEEMDFSGRTFNTLKLSGVNYVGQIWGKTEDELYDIARASRKVVQEVMLKLEQLQASMAG